MRATTVLGLLAAALLATTSLAAAQSGDGASSSSPPPGGNPPPPPPGSTNQSAPPPGPCANEATPEGKEQCRMRYCAEHNDTRCPTKLLKDNATRRPGNDTKPPAACDFKGNPVYCKALYCQNHEEASFCRLKEEAKEVKEGLKDAAKARKVGAEIDLRRGEAPDVLSYDNVTIRIKGTDRVARAEAPISITLSSNLTSGRTFAFTVNRSLLPDAVADRLVLRYFDVHDDGQTEAKFQRAGSLIDVLDPNDDGGQPEYWVVQDANGLEVLVSVPHWSTHIVTLGGLDAVVQPTVLVGLALGVAVSTLAAVALFVPRRRD